MPKLTVKIQSLGQVATAALLAGAFATPAVAAPSSYIYAGGATFPEKVYRDIMNCYGDSTGTDLEAFLVVGQATCNGLAGYNENIQALYVGVGSGNGLITYMSHNPADFTNGPRTPDKPPVPASTDSGAFYGAGVGAAWVPNTLDAGPFFPDHSFSASDDPLTAANLTTYNTNKVAGGWGNAIQVPSMVGPVGVPYKPASGVWTEAGVSVAGNASKLKLDRNVWCGIFTGKINDWNDPLITANNGGISLTGGVSKTITVVYRNDGSGTTFVFTNGLLNQCGQTSAPTTGVSAANAVPDSTNGDARGDWITDSGITINPPGSRFKYHSNNNFYRNIAPVAGVGLLPANFLGAAGNGGIKATVLATPGSIGYSTTDFINLKNNLPDSTGPKSANLQTWATPVATPTWKAPTSANALKVMNYSLVEPDTYLKVPSFSKTCASLPQGCATNPLDWGKENPIPNNLAAWPIAGYTFIDVYTCYGTAGEVTDLVGTTVGALGFLRWYFGTTTENASRVKTALTRNGFATVPGAFSSGARKLLTTNAPTKLGTPGQTATGCATVVGPGA